MLISNRLFSGERPKRDERNLEVNEAVVALDCDLVSTSLRPLKASVVEKIGVSASAQTLVRFQDEWFTFEDAIDIIESSDRLFWTTTSGEARQATFAQMQLGQSSAMGVPAPDTPVAVVSGTGTGILTSTSVLYTFVNVHGEEGDASEVTEIFEYLPGQTISYSNLNEASFANQLDIDEYAIAATRIYRLSQGEFKFLAEVPVGTTTFDEVTGTITLAEVFLTNNFVPPPSGMQGLHLMANGVAIGFVPGTREVYASEPFNVNAWPYFFPVKDLPVALSSYDNNAVVMTDAYPEVAAINDPRNIIPTRLTFRQPCVSRRSVVQAQGGVMYASTNGIFYVGRGGGDLLTRQWVDERDWQVYNPDSFVSVYKDDQYIGFHEGAKEGNAFVFDTREPNAVIRQLSQATRAAYVTPGTDDVYVIDALTGEILQLEASDFDLTYTWKSKTFGNGSPFALTSRRVLACRHVDRGYTQFSQDVIDAAAAVRAAELAILAALPLIYGTGGAINQHVIGGCGIFDIPGGPVNQDLGVTVGGGRETELALYYDYSVVLKVYRDKELVHQETIVDDEDINRLTYFDRGRYYTYELEGILEVQQIDLAGSNSEFHTGT